jgi:hypothetical protein
VRHRLLSLVLLLFCSMAAFAHEVRPAYLEIDQRADGAIDIVWKQAAATAGAVAIAPRFSTGWTDAEPAGISQSGDAIVKTWHVGKPASGLAGVKVEIDGLATTITDVLVRVIYADGSEVSRLIKPSDPVLTLAAATKGGAPVREYLELGFVHIWSGIDHLLYVFGLVLLVRTPRLLLKTITGFTVAHSISLGAAALGYVHIPPAPVEAAIALSIVYIAIELLHARQGREGLAVRAPWLVAMGIGLLHGLGFAGALAEVGLPQNAIPQALLLFNIGIEIGQISFVALVLAAIHLFTRFAPRMTFSLRWLPPYAIGSFASFWVIDRIHAFL